MKKISLLFSILLMGATSFAGGIVTNTNQSASYVRMLARDASTDVDAVFFNPAGLSKLQDGFYVQLNSQTIKQDRKTTNSILNAGSAKEYEGSIFVPVLPTAYLAYKSGDFVVSGGFVAIGGGGSVSFDKGIPDFELMAAMLGAAVTDMSIKGTSMYLGGQAGLTYKINDMISVYGGARYVKVMNSYEGKVTMMGQGWPAPASVTIDAEQSGSGITPMVGVNLTFMEDKLNLAVKYELATKIDVTNASANDQSGMFPDGAEVASDMPAFLSVGLGYQLTEKLYASAGYHMYFDKSVDYGKNGFDNAGIYQRGDNANWVDNNSYEIAVGLQYNLTEKFALSGGYLMAKTGVADSYQSTLTNSLSSNTFSVGALTKLSDKFDLDLGLLYTSYSPYEKSFAYPGLAFTETYEKSNLIFAVGLTYRFGSN